MRITSKGQVTIPQSIREKLGLTAQVEVEFEVLKGGALIRKARKGKAKSRGTGIVARIRGKAKTGMRADELMALMRGDPAEV
jgi:AbrB family looped-hinge helix DNA binding protein